MMQSVGFLVGEWIRKGLKEGNVNTLIVLLIFDQIDKLDSTTTQNGRRGISNTWPNLHFLMTSTMNIECKGIF